MTQHHKDINELIADGKAKELQEKKDAELKRQQTLIKEQILPFLNNLSITSAKVLINNTLKTLNDLFGQKMKEEQMRLSSTTIIGLDIMERLERDEKLQLQKSLVDKVKAETIGTATGILSAIHVAIAGVEMNENSKRDLKTINLEM